MTNEVKKAEPPSDQIKKELYSIYESILKSSVSLNE